MNRKCFYASILFLGFLITFPVNSRDNADNNLIVIPSAENTFQQIIVTGAVTNEIGDPLPGTSVFVQGTTSGVVTDENGKYSIIVPNREAVLVFSYVGFAAQARIIDSHNEINVVLSNDEEVEELMVSALGISRKINALSYSAINVKGDELGQTSEVNIMNSLSGKIAGVNIIQFGTGIAGSSRVSIRGNTSINRNTNPMYVIDGIQVERDDFFTSTIDFGDVLNTINPNDIESINILKGAGTAALYGLQAANGVVLITSKKGNKKQGIGIDYNSRFGYNEYISPFKNRQKEYGQGIEGKKIIDTGNGWGSFTHKEWGAKYDGSAAFYPDGTTKIPWGYSYHADPWKTFTRKGLFMTNSFSISSGGNIHNYRLSVSDMRQQSPIPNSDMNRQTITLNTTSKLGKRLEVDAKIDYSNMDVNNRQNSQYYVDVLGNMPMMWDISWAKGITSKFGAQEDGKMLPWNTDYYYYSAHNPYWAAYQNETSDNRNRINVMLSYRLKITDWLFLTGRYGRDLNMVKARTVGAYESEYRSGSVSEFTNKNLLWTYDWSLVFDKGFGNFNINAMFGGAKTNNDFIRDSFTISGLDINSFDYSHRTTAMKSLYGSAEFAYHNFIYLTLTGRKDRLSALSPENNSIFSPSVGLSYIFSQQFQMPSWMTFGKLRGSYAKVGGSNVGALNESQDIGSAISLKTKEWEKGFDLRFLKNRISFDYTYYSKLSKDDIMVTIPGSMPGSNRLLISIGETSYKGHEFTLTVVPVKGNMTWDMTFMYSRNKNKVLDLGGLEGLTSDSSGLVAIKQIVGQPLNTIAGYRQAVDEVSGKPIWEWLPGFQIWLPRQTAQLENLGVGIHPNMASVTTTLSYKGLSLNAMIDGQWGAKVYSVTEYNMTANGHSKRTTKYRRTGIPVSGVYRNNAGNYVDLDHDTNIPYQGDLFERYYKNAFCNSLSEYNIFDASYAMLRQLSLGYVFPKSMFKIFSVQNAKISLVGWNLFSLYNKMPNGHAATLQQNGIEQNTMPISRSFSVNIDFSF